MDKADCAHKSTNSRAISPQPVDTGNSHFDSAALSDGDGVKLLAFPAAAHKPRHQRANHINNSLIILYYEGRAI